MQAAVYGLWPSLKLVSVATRTAETEGKLVFTAVTYSPHLCWFKPHGHFHPIVLFLFLLSGDFSLPVNFFLPIFAKIEPARHGMETNTSFLSKIKPEVRDLAGVWTTLLRML